jgi:hypothetical protein
MYLDVFFWYSEQSLTSCFLVRKHPKFICWKSIALRKMNFSKSTVKLGSESGTLKWEFSNSTFWHIPKKFKAGTWLYRYFIHSPSQKQQWQKPEGRNKPSAHQWTNE